MRHCLSDLAGGLLPGFGAGEDEGHQGFVDKHTVRFVDERNIGCDLDCLVAVRDLVVAQVVETDFRDGRVDDIAAVSAHAVVARCCFRD